CQQYNSLSFSF
nr:immunoglobulin light chain junction region [Macaca mulatta]MPN97524.1 immunoglobulin light chain junction region [Macaca mulatta]MPN97859.1 immunoglobulin light chain junction region [Macaca mulatta]MPO00871.1 immunoglobulin light chain junction region [Macaca mulatta]